MKQEERQEIIRSRRLVLKRMTEADITEAYVHWLNDFETVKYLEVRFNAQSRESVAAYVRRNLLPDSGTLHLGVFDCGGTRLVGTVTFNNLNLHHRSASISFVIGHPEAKGKGYGAEAVHAATHFLFTKKKYVKLYGGYYSDHLASEKVLLKNGFKIEGRLKKKLVNYRGERVDHIYVGITAEEFLPNPAYLGASHEDSAF
jgi:RimJ/RimL family protein N-acetyltransferase